MHRPIVRTNTASWQDARIVVAIGMPIGLSVSRNIAATLKCREGPGNRRLQRRHLQRGNAENQKQHVEKGIADLGRGQQKSELDRDMADDLKYGQVMIFEAVVEMRFRTARQKCRSG